MTNSFQIAIFPKCIFKSFASLFEMFSLFQKFQLQLTLVQFMGSPVSR